METPNNPLEPDFLEKLHHLKRVMPSAPLHDRIVQKIETMQANRIPMQYWRIAASIAFLVILDISAVFYFQKEGKSVAPDAASTNIVLDYNLYRDE